MHNYENKITLPLKYLSVSSHLLYCSYFLLIYFDAFFLLLSGIPAAAINLATFFLSVGKVLLRILLVGGSTVMSAFICRNDFLAGEPMFVAMLLVFFAFFPLTLASASLDLAAAADLAGFLVVASLLFLVTSFPLSSTRVRLSSLESLVSSCSLCSCTLPPRGGGRTHKCKT